MKNKITLFWFIIIFNFATLTVVAQNSNKIDPYLVYLKNTLIKNEVIDGKVPMHLAKVYQIYLISLKDQLIRI